MSKTIEELERENESLREELNRHKEAAHLIYAALDELQRDTSPLRESPTWREEFGLSYTVPAWTATLDPAVVDASWHNDACPRFFADVDGNLAVSLWVEHPDPEQRESCNPHRFSVAVDFAGFDAKLWSGARATGIFTDEGESCWTGDDEDEAQRVFRSTLAIARTLTATK